MLEKAGGWYTSIFFDSHTLELRLWYNCLWNLLSISIFWCLLKLYESEITNLPTINNTNSPCYSSIPVTSLMPCKLQPLKARKSFEIPQKLGILSNQNIKKSSFVVTTQWTINLTCQNFPLKWISEFRWGRMPQFSWAGNNAFFLELHPENGQL